MGTSLTGVLGGYTVNAESCFGTEVSAFFLSLLSMDQNICSGVRFLCGANVSRKLHASLIKNVDGKIIGKDGKPLKSAMRKPTGPNPKIGSKPVEPSLNKESLNPNQENFPVLGRDVVSRVSGVSNTQNPSMQELNKDEGIQCMNGYSVKNAAGPATEHVPSENKVGNNTNQSFASMFKKPNVSKAARLKVIKSDVVPGATVAIPLAEVKEVSQRFENTLYGYFIGKRLAFPLVENYVKNAWAKFGLERTMLMNGFFFFQFSTRDGMEQVLENGPWLIRMVPIMLNIWTPNTVLKKDTITSVPVWVKLHNVPIAAFTEVGLSIITSSLGKPIMLDSYTSTICQKSWGKNAYARVLIEVSSLSPLLDSVVVAVPFLDDTGYSFETVDVEYEWKPPRCDTCNIFDHVDSDCPKRIKVVVDADTSNDDGFTKVSRKRGKGKQTDKNRQVLGIKLTKPKSNLQYRPVVSAKPNSAAGESSKTHANTSDLNVDPKKGKDLDLRNSYEALDNDDNEFWTNASDVKFSTLVINESDNDDVDEELVINDATGASTPLNEVLHD
ncbi:zinc knuckle CX2CX4HX4C containing protein [Tanacetum coccineum]